MKRLLILLFLCLEMVFLKSPLHASSCPASLITDWKFKSESETKDRVLVGYSLTDPKQNLRSASGTYFTSIQLADIGNMSKPTLVIPAIGGLQEIRLNGLSVNLPPGDFAGVGPIITMPGNITQYPLKIEIDIANDNSSYAGMWKSAPMICNFEIARTTQASWTLWQETVPRAVAILCIGLCVFFLGIHFYTGKKFVVFARFSLSLFLWFLFFSSLSGMVRGLNYELGTSILYPSRIAASLGLLLLFYSYRGNALKTIDRCTIGATFLLIIPAYIFGLHDKINWQIHLLALSFLLQLPVVINLIMMASNSKRAFGIAILSIITCLGEISDLFKLYGILPSLMSNFPYFARVSLPPTLLISSAYFIWHFVKYFREVRLNDFRHRILSHLALLLSKNELTESTLVKLAKKARRFHLAKRTSISKYCGPGQYGVVGVSGFRESALGSKIDLNAHPHIKQAVATGKITFAYIESKKTHRYEGDFSLAVPLPMTANPKYLILVSDIRQDHRFNESELAISSNFFTTLSSAFMGNQERMMREEREREIKNLIQKLDPNLYEYVTRNVDNKINTIDQTCERGVIFFDQKSYVTMLESLHPDKAANALVCMKKWVGDCALRQNARIKGFYGDAFIIEIYPLPGEDNKDTISRTAKLVWELSEQVDNLNRELIKEKLPPIQFRFGAHFGLAANVDVDMVQSGTSTLIGDAVNLAQRIQGQAPAGGVLVSEIIAKTTGDQYSYVPMEVTYLKGRTGLVSLYRMIGQNQSKEAV